MVHVVRARMYLPDVVDQLTRVVGGDTGQVWAACLVNPLARQVESGGHLEAWEVHTCKECSLHYIIYVTTHTCM